MLFAPVIFVLVGGACFFGYSLDATRHAEIRKALDIRDAQGLESSIVEQLTAFSMSGWAMYSAALAGLTLPPYWMRTF